tara:strand:+ start:1317 stop:1841 length:525 start_codon:yes stop_codon:yes gene_type:complete
MAKISNTTAYPQVSPKDDDLLIITDKSDLDETKTVSIGALGAYYKCSTKEVELNANQILNSFTFPVLLLEPLGNQIIQVTSVVVNYTYGDAAFVWPSDAGIYAGINTAFTYQWAIDTGAVGATSVIHQPRYINGARWPALGAKIYFGAQAGNPTSPGTPTGNIKLSLKYRVIDF